MYEYGILKKMAKQKCSSVYTYHVACIVANTILHQLVCAHAHSLQFYCAASTLLLFFAGFFFRGSATGTAGSVFNKQWLKVGLLDRNREPMYRILH